jgi:hypothetical protein
VNDPTTFPGPEALENSRIVLTVYSSWDDGHEAAGYPKPKSWKTHLRRGMSTELLDSPGGTRRIKRKEVAPKFEGNSAAVAVG